MGRWEAQEGEKVGKRWKDGKVERWKGGKGGKVGRWDSECVKMVR